MRSLVLTLDAPSPRNGGPALRNLQTVHALAALGSVDVASIGVNELEDLPGVDRHLSWTYADLRRQRSTVERQRSRLWPLHRHGHPRLRAYVAASAVTAVAWLADEADPDLVVLSQWPTGPYGLPIIAGRRVVFDTHNVEADLRSAIAPTAESRLDRLAARRLEQWEHRLGSAADQVWVCSVEDDALWRSIHGSHPSIAVIPNTVETDLPATDVEVDRNRLLFTGTLSYEPNVAAIAELATTIMPAVRNSRPDAWLDLVGRKPTPEVERHADNTGIRLLGPVPDMLPHLRGARAMVVPLRSGGGTRLKILEAMAAGIPIVSTSKGVEGIAVTHDRHVLIADSPDDFVAAVVRLLDDDELASRLRTEAGELVRAEYSLPALTGSVAAALDAIGVR